MRFLISSIALLALTGCEPLIEGVNPLPTGYAYHQNEFKSQPGPPAEEIGYPFSPERNDVVMEKWQGAIRDLVDKFEANVPARPQSVYIEMLPRKNTFNMSMDYTLREEFRKRGYMLAQSPEHAMHLRPQAYLAEDGAASSRLRVFNGDIKTESTKRGRIDEPERAQNFIISLSGYSENKESVHVEGTYKLPAYGYVRGEGYVLTGPHIKQEARTADSVSVAPVQIKEEIKKEASAGADAPPESLVPAPVQEETLH
jgi:hypothetical protein